MNDKDFEKLVFGIAHQIRNPCAIILANTNVLLQDKALSAPARRSLESIVHGVKYLQSRMDEFVEFSRPVNLRLKTVPLSRLLQETVALVKEKCLLKRIKIASSADKGLSLPKADHEQLLLALLNILLNSIESISDGGRIDLQAKPAGGEILVTVSDTGMGIHPRDLPEVFSPFYSTKQGGIGIGLAVSKRIFEAHKGKISVESEQGKGTRVTIRLPAS